MSAYDFRSHSRTYQAAAAGQTVLQADGSPACRNATPPCGMPDREVLLTIIVQ